MLPTFLLSKTVFATETSITIPKINEIYPNAPGSSELGFEFIELSNTGTSDIDLSNYQLQVKDSTKKMPLSGTLPATSFKAFTTTFSLVNGGDIIQLAQQQDGNWVVIEEVSYSGGATEDTSWSYFTEGWELAPITKDKQNQKFEELSPTDLCTATPEVDLIMPIGYEINEQGDCVLKPVLCQNQVIISEFVTDPVGLEADGGEFIELYNSGDTPARLIGCHLKTSKSSADVITFKDEDEIPARGYFVINLTDKLTNASGSISFITDDHEDVVNYDSIHEGNAFALFGSDWNITDKSTPGQPNELLILSEDEPGISGQEATLAACPSGKYRSLETNRCRNLVVESADLEPCEPGQYRSPETNRCRKFSTATASLEACDPGQERNPSTNRCRKIASSSDDVKPCADGYERNPETNRCKKVVLAKGVVAGASTVAPSQSKLDLRIIYMVLALALGYGIYEYRTDIVNLYSRIVSKISSK